MCKSASINDVFLSLSLQVRKEKLTHLLPGESSRARTNMKVLNGTSITSIDGESAVG